VDVDVLDPAFAPGTGTPEAGGLATRELLELLSGLAGLDVVGCDVVEVCPAYDVADITGVAAATIAYGLINLIAISQRDRGASRAE
jgi:agmatinase